MKNKSIDTIKHFEDEELISSAKNGDLEAFNKLISKYNQTIYSFSFKICRNENKAKETLQDTLINVFKSLKNFDGKSKFSTWVYKIVTNNCLMMARKSKSKEHISVDDYKITIPEMELSEKYNLPSKNILDEELKSKLNDAIKKLPEKYRLVFLLRDVEDLTIDETSNILKISKPVVKTRLHRARVFLRNQLSDYYEKG